MGSCGLSVCLKAEQPSVMLTISELKFSLRW